MLLTSSRAFHAPIATTPSWRLSRLLGNWMVNHPTPQPPNQRQLLSLFPGFLSAQVRFPFGGLSQPRSPALSNSYRLLDFPSTPLKNMSLVNGQHAGHAGSVPGMLAVHLAIIRTRPPNTSSTSRYRSAVLSRHTR